MKKIILTLLILGIETNCFSATVVNSSSGGDSSGNLESTIATSSLNTTTGNDIIVTVDESQNGNDVNTISDTAGDTFVQGTSCYETSLSSYGNLDIWYALNITGNPSNIVTVHFLQGSSYPSVYQIQVSELSSSPFAVCAKNSANSSTSISSSSFSPSTSGNINIAVTDNNGNRSESTAGTNYAFLNTTYQATEYQLNASSGSQTASFTNSISRTLTISVASFTSSGNYSIIKGNSTINGNSIIN